MNAQPVSKVKAYIALGVTILFLGFSAILVGWADAPGPVTSFYRMAIASLVMAVPFIRRVRARAPLSKRGVRLALLAGVLFGLDLSSWASGVIISGATNPTLLANVSPLWVGLGAMILFRERLNFTFWGGLSLAMLGASAVLGMDAVSSASVGMGTLLGLLASFFYGGYILVTQRGREELDSICYFWISAASSALFLLILSLVWGLPLAGYPPKTYLSFLALGALTQSVGYLAMNYALGHLPATTVAPTLLGQPVLTALLAGPLLGERISFWQILTGMMVLVGVYLVHRSRQQSEGQAMEAVESSPAV